MSTEEPHIAEDDLYAPNQQNVRPDGSGPAEEGEGGSQPGEPDPKEANPLDAMTKDELLAEAAARGIEVPSGATKAEVRAALD
jgi:hypothetical protein